MSVVKQTNESTKQNVRWHGFTDLDALHHAAVACVVASASEAIAERGRFSIVLAGGNTPRALYVSLRDMHTDWSCWQVYFGDERCLPSADPQRNSAMVADSWLDHVPIPAEQVHVMRAERGAEAAAADYAQLLDGVGKFDLVLLGLGEDGHTASLFPGHDCGAGPDAPDALAVTDASKPPSHRVSLSAARLSRAREVLFLVAGQAKRDAVMRWRAGDDTPARSIRPTVGVDVLVESGLLIKR